MGKWAGAFPKQGRPVVALSGFFQCQEKISDAELMHEGELRHPVIVVGRGQGLEVAEEFGKSFTFKVVLKAFFVLG